MSASASARSVVFHNLRLSTTVAVLSEVEPPRLADALHKMLGGMPDFFNGEATILDLSAVTELPAHIDWTGLLSLFRRHQLQPIAVCNLPEAHIAGARKAGLAILGNSVLHDSPPAAARAPAPVPAAPAQTAPARQVESMQAGTLFIDRPLRSGQQVYARGGDLVLLAGMSNGAEVIADGSIHCFGPLRGRALAGAQGDSSARILTTNFGPELVSIAGVYRTFENGIPEKLAGHSAQTRLTGTSNAQTLAIDPIQLD